jgi:hypothetical protein
MPASRRSIPVQAKLDALRTEFADLAFDLERKGRRDAADIVMLIDSRVREMAEEIAAGEASDDETSRAPAGVSEEYLP